MDGLIGALALLMLIAAQFAAVRAAQRGARIIENGGRLARLPYWLAVFIGLAVIMPGTASAQGDYPNRTVKFLVGAPPGSNLDIVPRIIADKLAAHWGHPVIIENKPGAAQNLAAEVVAKSPPDGYTLLATPQGPLVVSQYFFPKLGFDPTAFVPVSIVASQPILLVANPKLPAANLKELVAFAKANPNKLNFATPGVGSSPHLTGEMLQADAGIRFTHVPYKGMPPAETDLIAGHVDVMFDNLSNVLPHIKDGRMKALGVASETRIPELPDVPAIAESYPGFFSTSWFAIVAPPKTPAGIADTVWKAISNLLKRPDVIARYRDLSSAPVASSPAETAAFLKKESERWRKVIALAGIKAE
jgi:tripartite-type tricarboxylate transporter receptor subunit TctC